MLYDLLKSRRSIRKFENREVEKEKLDAILKSALLSPSSRARRPWEFIAVTDRELLKKLSKCREGSSLSLESAALGIVIIADPDSSDIWIEDASIASVIIQLSAQSLGLASCWVQVRERFHSGDVKAEDYIKNILGIPERYKVENMVAIGYPAEKKEPHDEKSLLSDKLHFNGY